MSIPAGKLPLPELLAMKRRGDKIVMVTAYDAPGARFAEDAGIDIVLVGDTAAMVVLGYDGTTVPVTMDEMLFLTRTVVRAARRPIVVGDMRGAIMDIAIADIAQSGDEALLIKTQLSPVQNVADGGHLNARLLAIPTPETLDAITRRLSA